MPGTWGGRRAGAGRKSRGRALLVPLEAAEGYVPRRLDMTLSDGQAEALGRLLAGLRARGEIVDGAPVVTPRDAVRWLLVAIGAPRGDDQKGLEATPGASK